MHNLNDKTCPLINNRCLLKGCTLFNERLDGCEISIMNYNLYQMKEHIRAQLNQAGGVPESRQASDYPAQNSRAYPRKFK